MVHKLPSYKKLVRFNIDNYIKRAALIYYIMLTDNYIV